MVAVVIDRPLGEENIGALLLYDFPELVEMGGIQDGVAIDLTCEYRTGLEYLGGFSGFGQAYARGRASFFSRPFAIVEMQENNFVTEFSEASDRTAAAVFGVSGMSSRNYNLEFLVPAIGGRLDLCLRH
jgi:hypothetical protein